MIDKKDSFKDFFKDHSGKLSGKRLAGAITLIATLTFIFLVVFKDQIQHLMGPLWPLVSLVGAMFGLSIGERKDNGPKG